MATATRPALYQAITKSYAVRNVLHAVRGKKAERTLCGRAVVKQSTKKFDSDEDGACGKCQISIAVMDRAHPGWE